MTRKVTTAAGAVAPLRYGVVRWRSLVRAGACGVGERAVEHGALAWLNMSGKGLLIHWLDGCPCEACVKAAGGVVVPVAGVKGRAA